MAKTTVPPRTVAAIQHDEATRKNIPTAEFQPVVEKAQESPVRVAYERRNRDLDPQLVWRGKDALDAANLVVHAPPLYIQEKVHPKALVDDLVRGSRERAAGEPGSIPDLFADFNGLPKGVDKTEFYQHEQNWTNRLILGDSLQVMASLAEREGLRGKVQCIYFDPPYGIKFNSNFQWSTTSRDVKDGNLAHITREPEQVKAFRDTWRDGIHSYLTYLRDRLIAARELLTESGSIFVQIGDENVHKIRAVMDEVFGENNFEGQVFVQKTGGLGTSGLKSVADYLLWYSKQHETVKCRKLFRVKLVGEGQGTGARYDQVQSPDGMRRALTSEERQDPSLIPRECRCYQLDNLTSGAFRENTTVNFEFRGSVFHPGNNACWKTTVEGLKRLERANRIERAGRTIRYARFLDDFPAFEVTNLWSDVAGSPDKTYVVQTSPAVIARCILMASDPGDLVLDATCGSGTTAYVAEQWGRRWITIDTSRVALALARARIMGARYPYYLLADSRDGQLKEGEVTRSAPSTKAVRGSIRHGFVYERVPHIALGSIANNAEIDVIWEKFQQALEPLRESLNKELKKNLQEWEIPREAEAGWSVAAKKAHAAWWEARIARQKEIDASIAAHADTEYLYDKPYDDKKKVRVAGPFTVESVSPHRVLGVDWDEELIDPAKSHKADEGARQTFAQMILENLKTAGVQQAHKEDRIQFTSLQPWPGEMITADGRYREGTDEGGADRRAAIFIGPEFGTVTRQDLVRAAREAGDADFDILIACAFSYDAHATEFNKVGRITVLKARMNADLHMAADLKSTGKGNLFVIFGEPQIQVLKDGNGTLRVKLEGVDVFDPQTGEVRSDDPDGIACWFIDTDYDEESFFVRHAYFLGANDPYGALKTTLRAEVDADAWASLHSDTSRPFPIPKRGRIAVKVINHLGDEVMKVFKVG